MNKRLSLIVFVVCLIFPCKALALATPPTTKAPAPASVSWSKNGETLVIRGTIDTFEGGDGTALLTDHATYPLIGGDFAMIIGQEVTIIGTMVSENQITKIAVARVQFLRP